MSAESLTLEMTATCTKAMIEWGDAIRAAEKAKDSSDPLLKSATATHAKASGLRVLELATGISQILHPDVG